MRSLRSVAAMPEASSSIAATIYWPNRYDKRSKNLMRSHGMIENENYRDLLTRLSTVLAMTEAAYLEARPRRDL
jgi:hypothetical protein